MNARDLPGKPDIVNRTSRWAIFVHGCFWHAHDGCSLWKVPKQNDQFWRTKFLQNRERDRRRVDELKALGYAVLVIWQCELEDGDHSLSKLLEFIEKRNGLGEQYRSLASLQRTARIVVSQRSATVMQRPFVSENLSIGDPRAAFDQSFLQSRVCEHPVLKGGEIRVADLFCGCGGLSLGVREASWAYGMHFEAALAVDSDVAALAVYKDNFYPKHASTDDLRLALDGEIGNARTGREQKLTRNLGRIDIVIAGPPCQGYSDLNNSTRRRDPRNQLYERVARFVELVEPSFLLIENVPGVVHGHEASLERTRNHLAALGYEIDEQVVDLLSIGVPQTRKRHILVGVRTGKFSIAEAIDRHVTPIRDIAWAMKDLEDERPESIFSSPSRSSIENLQRIRYLFDSNSFNLPNARRPACHQNDSHSYKSMYGRLRWDRPAQTITSGFGSPGQGRFVHPSRLRVISPHEAARLQFFPDWFSFAAANSRTSLANMIGNAAPMKLAYVVFMHFLNKYCG